MSYKLAIFDLDGTILDTLDDLSDSANFALAAHNFPIRTREEIRRFVGNGVRKLIERALPADMAETRTDEVLATFLAHYKTNCNNKTKPYDGILTMLRRLRERGCKTAVLSNKADAPVQTLIKLYFDGLIDYAAGEKEGIPRKPAPDGVYAILEHFDVEAGDCAYIGDSDVDVDTAKNSGMDYIGVDWGFRDREELMARGGNVIARTVDALTSFICK